MDRFIENILNTLSNIFFSSDYIDLDYTIVINVVGVLLLFYTLIRCITLIVALIVKFIKGVAS